jgi:hypothetical protein
MDHQDLTDPPDQRRFVGCRTASSNGLVGHPGPLLIPWIREILVIRLMQLEVDPGGAAAILTKRNPINRTA